jgi:CHAT domain-containing protein
LLTYDGKLSMNELADLVGRTRFRARGIELLTLSACQTAAGNDRAALGLAGVALRAGARSALATLWSVNDRAAAALVVEFYTQLGDPEVSRAEALRRAQLKTLRNHAYRHPIYWSPYLLISSWL